MKAKISFLGIAVAGLVILAAGAVHAQTLNLDLGEGGQLTGRIIQFIALLTILSLAPSILVMVTSFTRIVVVLSLMRSAIGVQQSPPNTVIVSLALFLTFFVMQPTLQATYDSAIVPLMNEEIDEGEAFERGIKPFHAFMTKHVREKDLQLFLELSGETPQAVEEIDRKSVV
jgi:flagellar biosynthetic protein FliP